MSRIEVKTISLHSSDTNTAWAGEDLLFKRNHAVNIVDGGVFLGSAAVVPNAILLNTPEPNDAARVQTWGYAKAYLGGTVSEGNYLISNDDGELIVGTTGIIKAMESGVAGDLIDVQIGSPSDGSPGSGGVTMPEVRAAIEEDENSRTRIRTDLLLLGVEPTSQEWANPTSGDVMTLEYRDVANSDWMASEQWVHSGAAWSRSVLQQAQTSVISSVAQDVIVYAKAVTGKSYAVSDPVQVVDASPPSPTPAEWSEFADAEVDDISAAAIYDLPATTRAQGHSVDGSYNTSTLTGTEILALRFEALDQTGSIGAVDWRITGLTISGNQNTADHASQRYEIWGETADNPDEAQLIAATTAFDWSEFDPDNPTGLNTNVALALIDIPIANGTKFWVVLDGSKGANGNTPQTGTRRNWGTFGDEFNRSEYVVTALDGGSDIRYSATGGSSWGPEPNASMMRVEVNLERTTDPTPSTSVYGVCLDAIDENTRGRVCLYGVVSGINASGSQVSETWNDNDSIWVNPVDGKLTNVQPVDPRDHILIGQVFTAASAPDGSLMVTASVTGSRGYWMSTAVYDPHLIQSDAFDRRFHINSMESKYASVDSSGLVYVTSDNVQDALSDFERAIDSGVTQWIDSAVSAQMDARGSKYQRTAVGASPTTLGIINDDLGVDDAKTIVLWVVDPNQNLQLDPAQDPDGAFAPPSTEYTIVLEHRNGWKYVR